jgi:enoyl-CoA hydratase/carnithine racemase
MRWPGRCVPRSGSGAVRRGEAMTTESPAGAASDPVLVNVADGIGWVTLNRPEKRNPISDQEMVSAIVAALASLAEDADRARVVILTGAGTAFSAGGDVFAMADAISERRSSPSRTATNYRDGIQRIALAVYDLQVPVIAAVNGPAIGAGCDLACMCDIRLAADNAIFAESFVKLGLISGDGGTWFLQRVVGYARACELTFTGERIDAATALSIGLVSAVVPAADLRMTAEALARRIAGNPPAVVRASKRLMKFAQHGSLRDTLEMSANEQALAQTTDEHQLAVTQMVDRLRRRGQ